MAKFMREHPLVFILSCGGIMSGVSPASITEHYDD